MQLSSISSTTATSASSAARATRVDRDGDVDAPRERSSASGPAQMFQKLQALAKSDPAKFKETTAAMAKTVQDAADAATDPREKEKLTELAKKFTEASKTGDASGLKPPEHGGGHRGPPPAGGPPGGASGSSKETDPADTNQDGKVSEQERAAYDAKQQQSKAVGAYAKSMKEGHEAKGHALFDSLSAMVDAAS